MLIYVKDFVGLLLVVIVIVEYDFLCDEGEVYGCLFYVSGVKVEMIWCDGMLYGFYDMGVILFGVWVWIEKGVVSFCRIFESV